MKKIGDLVLVWLGGLVIVSLAATFQSSPGYMDAEYYFAGGKLIQQGQPFREPYLWNYLANPESLLAPAFTYWMPLASIIAWLGMILGRSELFQVARLPFLILSSFVPPLTYALSWQISGQRFTALFAALLAWYPMYYLAYLTTTDTFAIYMILGSIWLVLAGKISELKRETSFLAGIVSGLLHLARADGLLWTVLLGAVLVIAGIKRRRQQGKGFPFGAGLLFAVGYLLVMGAWYGRNWIEFHSLFPPGNQRALFLRTYNDLFRYPASDLNFRYFLKDGLAPLIHDRLYATGQNLQTLIAVQMEILLFPLFILGYWKKRSEPIVQAGFIAWLVIFGLMSVVFPFAGWRGGYFHASAAFQPLVWCLASEGLGCFIRWGSSKRNWNATQGLQVFSTGIVVFLLILTVYLYKVRVIGKDLSRPFWDESQKRQAEICNALQGLIAREKLQEAVIMINNPIGFYLACEKPALSVPVGGEQAIRMVARQFRARFLILESDHPPELADYFFAPRNTGLLTLIDNQQEWKIYRIHETP